MLSIREFKKIGLMIVILLILDAIYFYIIGTLFSNQIMNIQRVVMSLRLWSVIVCYILIFIVLYYFIIRNNRDPFEAFLLGFCIYGIYDSTNYATFKKWMKSFAIIDTLWGGILFAITTKAVQSIKY